MKAAIIGSRSFGDYRKLSEALREFPIAQVISGGARGADSLAKLWARNNNIELVEYLPDYIRHGKGAPLVRNKLIVDSADIIIAFWDGKSTGTKYTIDYAISRKKKVHVVRF